MQQTSLTLGVSTNRALCQAPDSQIAQGRWPIAYLQRWNRNVAACSRGKLETRPQLRAYAQARPVRRSLFEYRPDRLLASPRPTHTQPWRLRSNRSHLGRAAINRDSPRRRLEDRASLESFFLWSLLPHRHDMPQQPPLGVVPQLLCYINIHPARIHCLPIFPQDSCSTSRNRISSAIST